MKAALRHSFRILFTTVVVCGLVQSASAKTHVVEDGQTLWEIAKQYGCGVAELKKANDLDGAIIRAGQELEVPSCKNKSGRKSSDSDNSVLTYYVIKGDSLQKIASRYDTTVRDIKALNQLKNSVIQPGQKLKVTIGKNGRGRAIHGQSIGAPHDGTLANAVRLPRGKGYFIRRPERAWGANHTVHHVLRAIKKVRQKYKVHDLAVGDLSARKGGPISQHRSHQSGRDVDVGLYFKKRPKNYPEEFAEATEKNLHFEATWALLQAFAETRNEANGVEVMFLNYDVQRMIYNWAKKKNVSQRVLDRMFQYPRGKDSVGGLVRHEDGHEEHIHVRMKCPASDKKCR